MLQTTMLIISIATCSQTVFNYEVYPSFEDCALAKYEIESMADEGVECSCIKLSDIEVV